MAADNPAAPQRLRLLERPSILLRRPAPARAPAPGWWARGLAWAAARLR